MLSSPQLFVLAAAPVVDLDGTFFVQGGLFLFMVIVLRPLLFKPWLEVRERRSMAIEGAAQKAEEMRAQASDISSDYDRKLAEARERAAGVRSQARREEQEIQAGKLAAAREEAAASLESARTRLQGEAASARTQLAQKADELAGTIVTKVLGRTA